VSEANLVLFALLGGTALLLYGVRLVGEGLQRVAVADFQDQRRRDGLRRRRRTEILRLLAGDL
jgi:Na+/phosphate symporter